MTRICVFLFLLSLASVKADDISFEQTIFIKSSSEKVWDALTNPQIVKAYFLCPLKKIGNAKGEDIIYGTEKDDLIKGKIISFNKNKEFSHSFKFLPPGHEGTEKDEATKVTYSMTEDEGVVILTLVHSGFKEKNQSYHNVTGGWPYILSNLKTYLETGKTLYQK